MRPNRKLSRPIAGGLALLIAVLGIAVLGYGAARNRAMTTAGGDARKLHSLPKYYGLTAGMFAAVPALGVMVIWLLVRLRRALPRLTYAQSLALCWKGLVPLALANLLGTGVWLLALGETA